MLLSSAPTHGNEGGLLNLTGHTLSLTPTENAVWVGGEVCEILSAEQDPSFAPPACLGSLTCTQEMRTVVALTCRLPHLSAGAHDVTLATVIGGHALRLEGAIVTTPPQLRAFAPAAGSVAGGTLLTLVGDGFSSHSGHVDVSVGGHRCRVVASNASYVSCVTSVAADVSVSSVAPIVIRVKGEAASCVAGVACEYSYDRDITPVLTGAAVTSPREAGTNWTVELSGSFGTGSDFPPDAVVLIGGTPCAIASVTATLLTCVSDPPFSGAQVRQSLTMFPVPAESLAAHHNLCSPPLATLPPTRRPSASSRVGARG